jgi:antitoxin component YwqK of YwqJK toxin-antitoxin module
MMYPNLLCSRLILLFAICSLAMNSAWAQPEFTTKHDSINWVDAKGMKQGKFRKADRNGKTVYEGYFRNNHPYGTFTYFDEDGQVTAVSVFAKDGKSCHTKMFDRDGMLMGKGKYVNELKDSVWLFYSSDTIITRESYTGGKQNGPSIKYFHNGSIADQSVWKNGVQEGPWKQFNDNGSMRGEGNYVNGCLDGQAIYYAGMGVKRVVGNYKNCLKDGNWVWLKPDGTIERNVLYKNGDVIGGQPINFDKLLKDGLEEFKDRNEKEHGGGIAPENDKNKDDGGY